MMNSFCCIEDFITIMTLFTISHKNFVLFVVYWRTFFLHNVNVFIEKQLSSQKLVA